MAQPRNTVQKQIIYDVLVQRGDHPTAEEVYADVHARLATISKGTVYRVLNQMAEQRSILRIPIPNGADRFDHTIRPHHHFGCTRCGRIYDMPAQTAEGIQITYPVFARGKITGYSILFEGICEGCGE